MDAVIACGSNMHKKEMVALGCLSLMIGAVPALFVPLALIKRQMFSDTLWAVVAPAWALLDPGAHDGLEILLAVLLDAVIFGALVYGIIYAVVRLFFGEKYQ